MSTDNPYIGLRTYNEDQKDKFWGREDDIERLAETIIENPSTLIYGCSGCGKSSIIKAGIMPKLNEYEQYGQYFYYMPILLNPKSNLDSKTGKLHIWGAISDSIDNALIKHESISGFWANRGDGLDGKRIEPGEMKNISLWEKLNLVTYQDNRNGNQINFLIIIDQFEEIFQLNLNLKEIQVFFGTYELMCGYFKRKSIESIIDCDPNSSIVNVEVLKEFLHQIPASNHRLVVSIRQDFLYELEANAESYPILYKNRVHVSPLNEEQAFKVITSSKKGDGTHWFRMQQAINIIKDLTGCYDFDIDGYPEVYVDPMMLSLYLQELCNNDSIESSSAENIIRDFYFKNMNIRGVEALESALLSSDGRYRKPIPYEDAEKIVPRSVLEELDDLGILTKSLNNKTDWIELRHDKLCEYAQMHIEAKEIKEKNIRNHSPLIYLTVQGRQMHENSYVIPNDIPQHLSFLHFIKGGLLNAPELNLDFSGILQNSSAGHHCELRMSVMDKNDANCDTEDGIREISVKIVKGKIYDICFYGPEQMPYELYFGVGGITFYYDSAGRVILKDYYRLKANANKEYTKERVSLENGYTSILYLYEEDSECPAKTVYLNLNLKRDANESIKECGGDPKNDGFVKRMMDSYQCRHRDGNCGYISTYDNMGCENLRQFIDENGNECILEDGHSQIRFERHPNDRIKSISYYRSGERCEINGVHKREYLYDETLTKVQGEVSYDSRDQIFEHKKGFKQVYFSQNGDIILVRNEGTEGPYELITLNTQSRLECSLSYNKDGNGKIILDTSPSEYRIYSPNGTLKAICELDTRSYVRFSINSIKYFPDHSEAKNCKEIFYEHKKGEDKSKKDEEITITNDNGIQRRIKRDGDISDKERQIFSMMTDAYKNAENTCQIRLQYGRMQFENGLSRIRINDKFGYIDTNFRLAIGCIFEDAEEFVEANLTDGSHLTFAKVKYRFEETVKWGTISPKGEFIISPTKYDKIFDYNPLNEGLIKVEYDDLQAFVPIDHDINEEFEIEIKYPFCHDFFIDKNLLIVGEKDPAYPNLNKYLYGAVNRHGEMIIKCEYDELNEYYTAYKTLIIAGIGRREDRKYGLFDMEGNIILPPIYKEIKIDTEDKEGRTIKATSDQTERRISLNS